MVIPGEHKTVQARTLLHQLMTAQIRAHDLDLDGILAQAVPEILAQPVREFSYSLLPNSPTAVGVSER